MAKTQQQYHDEHYAAGLKEVDKAHQLRKKTDAATLKQINEAIDKATATQTGQYQQRIDAAPLESRVEYDQNAINDAVSKKRIQETLANMGLTDSGLTSSMQTALAIQKQKADRSVKVNENAKIQAAQNAIDSILADAETKKADAKIQRETATADWYAGALADLENSSSQAAAEAYAADMDYAAKAYEANQKYNAQVIADQNAANEKRNKAIQDAVDQDVENGMDKNTAWQVNEILYGGDSKKKALWKEAKRDGYSDEEALAYVSAGGGDAGDAAVYKMAMDNANTFVSGVTSKSLKATGWDTFWSNEKNDATFAANKISDILVNGAGKNLTEAERALVTPSLVGKCIAINWSKDMDGSDNAIRLTELCSKFGITGKNELEKVVASYNANYPGGKKMQVENTAADDESPEYKLSLVQ